MEAKKILTITLNNGLSYNLEGNDTAGVIDTLIDEIEEGTDAIRFTYPQTIENNIWYVNKYVEINTNEISYYVVTHYTPK